MAVSLKTCGSDKRISAIKRCTDDKIVYETLLTFTPKPAKYETLGDLFRNIKKEQRNKSKYGGEFEEVGAKRNGDFQTALKVFEEDEHKKREQTTIKDFFKTFEASKSEEVNETKSGGFQTALHLFEEEEERKKEEILKENELVEGETDVMGEKKNPDLKTLFGDESDDDEMRKIEKEVDLDMKQKDLDRKEKDNDKKEKDHDKKVRKRKHEDKHRRLEKKPKLGESSIDKEYEKFVEAVENNTEKKQEQNGEGSNKIKKNKLKKTEIGNLVVKLLTPAYVERRFESRETFKSTARNISHALIDKDENEIKEFVENFLKKNDEITSQTML